MNRKKYLLELEHISKSYPAPGDRSLPVLNDINLALEKGESVAITGPSGSGKSTLLNIIGALDRPSAGKLLLEGRDIATLDEEKRAELRNRKIGFVFQQHHLLPQCNVLENVLVPSIVNSEAFRTEQRALELLAEVGLCERLAYMPWQLSGGERQRVAVVRAMINNPDLLVADEPTGSLDRASAEKLAELLIEMNRKHGLAMVVVTHSAALAARMDSVFELVDGALVPGRK